MVVRNVGWGQMKPVGGGGGRAASASCWRLSSSRNSEAVMLLRNCRAHDHTEAPKQMDVGGLEEQMATASRERGRAGEGFC